LFWLSFHNLPLWVYKILAKWTLKNDGYLNIYFHPWEFTDLDNKEAYNFPSYVSKNSGHKMAERLDDFIIWLKQNKNQFATFRTFLEQNQLN
jgi:hypothetical protein